VTAPSIPELTTQRLLLRGWRDGDRGPFAAINADPTVMHYFVSTLDRTESDALVDRILASWAEHGYGLWAIERLADERFLGFTGLTWQDFPARHTPAVEVGWRLATEAWGQGYATEAARAALRFGFETVGLEEILSWTTVTNTASRRVMERIGLHRDPGADFEHPRIPVGHPVRPHVLYRLRRDEWLASTGAAP